MVWTMTSCRLFLFLWVDMVEAVRHFPVGVIVPPFSWYQLSLLEVVITQTVYFGSGMPVSSLFFSFFFVGFQIEKLEGSNDLMPKLHCS